jgi:dehydrogenase/reductase SDR family protein 12
MFQKIKDALLDFSITYSFDKTGYIRHQKYFTFNLNSADLSGQTGLVTGGSSGLGSEVVNFARGKGAVCYFTGRRKMTDTYYLQSDISNWDSIHEVVEKLPELDFVVLNAGAMPGEFSTNAYGIESQFASQLFGHYFLFKALYESKKLKKNSRVVWVSSGGMYLKSLDLTTIQNNPKYDKVKNYANVKRAQVSLVRFLNEQNKFPDVLMSIMHPGWALTPGLQDALDSFTQSMEHRLRNLPEGADTINWLIAADEKYPNGKLWFDRKVRKDSFFFWAGYNRKKTKLLYEMLEENYSKVFTA